jgi:hypothetical protein
MSTNGSTKMKNYTSERNTRENIWIVVSVQSGIPVDVKVFRNKDLAYEFAVKLRDNIDPDMDRISVFEIPLPDGIG